MVTRPMMVKDVPTSDTGATTQGSDGLDRTAFLNLLVTQLQHQDPLQPMADRDFIAQLAQLSSLEQMQQINAGLAAQQMMLVATQALTLVGRDVSYQKQGSQDPIRGTVQSVRFNGGTPKLLVGEDEVALSDVVQVW